MQKHPAPVQSARTFFPPLPEGEPLLALNEFELVKGTEINRGEWVR